MKNVVGFLNKYSLIFHALLACSTVFIIEVISRRNFFSACTFVGGHTLAFLYNAFIIFASLMLVYLFRRRAFWRVIITGFWTFLGIINGCILSNRVTPFGYTDLKCISDLLSMTNTSYFTAEQATIAVIGVCVFLVFCVLLFVKGPRYQGRLRKIAVPAATLAVLFIALPLTTKVAKNTNVVASYFSNIAQGYEDYGFVYGFSSSVVGRGMSKPDDYSKETIGEIMNEVEDNREETTVNGTTGPNIICVLLESFCDPDEINFLEVSEDPIPTFHALEENYTTGYLTVPVVGAGTANTEFEVLTGMSMQHFGTGEYPYKTILKKTDCESIASDLGTIGYSTHAVHNNGGNFYSRVNAFSMMGFDTFTSKELMNITEYTPAGTWPTDDILVSETIKTLDSTPDQADFTYTITVGTHGDYPTEQVIEDPVYTVSGVEDEGSANAWTYYVNQLHEADNFIADLIAAVDARGEDTVIVMFGDHLPTMGLEDEDMRSGDIYKTKYITWNNMNLPKEDADLYAYQLLASVTDSVGIHEGTVLGFHQAENYEISEEYEDELENLQYDILYGNRYCYNGADAYPATDIVMGIDDVTIKAVRSSYDRSKIYIIGSGFTKWSKVYVNGEKVSATYVSGNQLTISASRIADGDTVQICQVGSNNTVFRSSQEWIYEDPYAEVDTETEAMEPEEQQEEL
jgi:phosphoglycerol transferase MdoB-like AlkP superfamily enzyme